MPTSKEIFEYWNETNKLYNLESERHCFACITESNHLEKAHIIAASVGGLAIVENLVLLCRRCHEDAPMTLDIEIMIDWINNRETQCQRWTRLIEELMKSDDRFKHLNPPEDFNELLQQRLKRLKADNHPSGNCEATILGIAKSIFKDLADGFVVIE